MTGADGVVELTDYGYFPVLVPGVSPTLNTGDDVVFSAGSVVTSGSISFDGTSTITLNSSGVYQVDYGYSWGNLFGPPAVISPVINGSSTLSLALSSLQDHQMSSFSFIVSVSGGTTLRLRNVGLPIQLTPSNSPSIVALYMTITRLGP